MPSTFNFLYALAESLCNIIRRPLHHFVDNVIQKALVIGPGPGARAQVSRFGMYSTMSVFGLPLSMIPQELIPLNTTFTIIALQDFLHRGLR